MNEISVLDASTPSPPANVDASATYAVVQAVADAKDVSPLDLSPPLYSAVDTDALETFVDSLGGDHAAAQTTFRYSGFDVTVAGDGSVSLERAPLE